MASGTNWSIPTFSKGGGRRTTQVTGCYCVYWHLIHTPSCNLLNKVRWYLRKTLRLDLEEPTVRADNLFELRGSQHT